MNSIINISLSQELTRAVEQYISGGKYATKSEFFSKFTMYVVRRQIIIKKKVEKQEKIFRKNPFDLKLKTHKLSGPLKDF